MIDFHQVSKVVVLGGLLMASTCAQAMDYPGMEEDSNTSSSSSLQPTPQDIVPTARPLLPFPTTPQVPATLDGIITLDCFYHALNRYQDLKPVRQTLHLLNKSTQKEIEKIRTSFTFASGISYSENYNSDCWDSWNFGDMSRWYELSNLVCSWLPNQFNLMELHIQDTDLSDQALVTFASLPKLKTLIIRQEKNLTDAGIQNFTGLTSLELAKTNISGKGIQVLTNITNLDLDNTDITNEEIHQLTDLQSLKLFETNIPELKNHPNLTSLVVISPQLDIQVEALPQLARFISTETNITDETLQSFPKIEFLMLSNEPFVNGSCFSHLKCLKMLKLNDICIDIEHLKNLQTLETLSMNNVNKMIPGTPDPHSEDLSPEDRFHIMNNLPHIGKDLPSIVATLPALNSITWDRFTVTIKPGETFSEQLDTFNQNLATYTQKNRYR
jgi:hypothetical protein